MFFYSCLLFVGYVSSMVRGQSAPSPCPDWFLKNPLTSDFVKASDHVSWNDGSFQGKLGMYDVVQTCEMWKYDTRMRIYKRRDNTNTSFIVFRPTQQNDRGGSIHGDRYVAPCTFLRNESLGYVHNHFQEAFIEMNRQCHDTIETLRHDHVYVMGHSLGGSFTLFMTASLVNDYHIIPKGAVGFAGTFIGDESYTKGVQNALHSLFPLLFVETVDINNPSNRDGTSEGYQTFDNRLFIDRSMICGFYIYPLGSGQSYGMHDIKNYWLAVENN